MNYTPAQSHERNQYVERTLTYAISELRTPEIADSLGSHAVQFAGMLECAVVANVVDGEVRLPDTYDFDVAPLPVVGIHPDEVLHMSNDFNSQTAVQRANTIKKFESWGPRLMTTEMLYNRFTGGDPASEEDKPDVFLHDLTQAMTGTSASFIRPEDLRVWFEKSPSKGFGLIFHRPVMFLRMISGAQMSAPDTVGHELVHVRQRLREPVRVISSQRRADMVTLRGELEAYHYACPLSLKRYDDFHKADKIAKVDGHTLLQILVEHTRRQNVLDSDDPFAPSGFLWQKLNEAHAGSILHGNIDYEEMLAMLQNCNQDSEAVLLDASRDS